MAGKEYTLQGMTIKLGRVYYIIPILFVKQSFKARNEDLIVDPNNNEMINIKGEVYNLVRLYDFFNIATSITNIEDGIVIMLENGNETVCLLADEIIGEQQTAVKAIPEYVQKIKGISGCSLLSSGEINFIIDISAFFDSVIETNRPVGEENSDGDDQISSDELIEEDATKDKYFTFEIENEEYGIDIVSIKEIISICLITQLPETPHYVEGVINLRGDVIPVINVKKLFQKPTEVYDKNACIVVIEHMQYIIGLIVDRAHEIASIDEENAASPPTVNVNHHSQYVHSIGKTEKKVILLLDLNKVLFSDSWVS